MDKEDMSQYVFVYVPPESILCYKVSCIKSAKWHVNTDTEHIYCLTSHCMSDT